jgi:hypothetical protein
MKKKLKRKAVALLLAGATGAVLAYLLDPVSGEPRRERLARRVTDATADLASARQQLAETVDDVGAAVAGDDPAAQASVTEAHAAETSVTGAHAAETSVTEALADHRPMPDIGGVTTPEPTAEELAPLDDGA